MDVIKFGYFSLVNLSPVDLIIRSAERTQKGKVSFSPTMAASLTYYEQCSVICKFLVKHSVKHTKK